MRWVLRWVLRVWLPAVTLGLLAELIVGAFGVHGAATPAVGFCTSFAASYLFSDLADL